MEKHYKYRVPHLKGYKHFGVIIYLSILFSANVFAQKPFTIPKIYEYDVAIDSIIIQPFSNPLKGNVKHVLTSDSIRVVYEDSTFYYVEKRRQYYSKDGLQYKTPNKAKPYHYKKITEDGKVLEQWFDNAFQQKTYTTQDGKLIRSTHGNSFTNYKYTPRGKLFYIQMYFADTLDAGYDQLNKTNEVDEQYIALVERLVHKLTYNKKDQIAKRETFSSDIYSDAHFVTTIDNYSYDKNGKVLGFNKKSHEYESPEYTSVTSRLDQLNYKEAKETSNYYEAEEIIVSYDKKAKINKVEIVTGESHKITFNITHPATNKVLIDITVAKQNELQRWVYEKQRHYLTYDVKGNIIAYKNVALNKDSEEIVNQFTKRKIIYYEN